MSNKLLIKLGYALILTAGILGYSWHTLFERQVRETLEGLHNSLSYQSIETNAFAGTADLMGLQIHNAANLTTIQAAHMSGIYDGYPDQLSFRRISITLPGAPRSTITAAEVILTPINRSAEIYEFKLKELKAPAMLVEELFFQPNFATYSPLEALLVEGAGTIRRGTEPDLLEGEFQLKQLGSITIKRQPNRTTLHLTNSGFGSLLRSYTPGLTEVLVQQAAKLLSQNFIQSDVIDIHQSLMKFLKPKGQMTLEFEHQIHQTFEAALKASLHGKKLRIRP